MVNAQQAQGRTQLAAWRPSTPLHPPTAHLRTLDTDCSSCCCASAQKKACSQSSVSVSGCRRAHGSRAISRPAASSSGTTTCAAGTASAQRGRRSAAAWQHRGQRDPAKERSTSSGAGEEEVGRLAGSGEGCLPPCPSWTCPVTQCPHACLGRQQQVLHRALGQRQQREGLWVGPVAQRGLHHLEALIALNVVGHAHCGRQGGEGLVSSRLAVSWCHQCRP